MTRTTTWLAALSCAVLLACFSQGCGGSSPASNGKGGNGGSKAGNTGSSGASGNAGSSGAGTTGNPGTSGDNGTAGSTAGTGGGSGGSTAGTGGGSGGSTAGTGGGTAGTTDAGMDTSGDTSDAKSDTAEVAATPCVAGGTCSDQTFTCSITRTCRRNQEQFCFCAPNNKIACEPCDTVDAGTDAGSDAGTDASTDSGTDAGTALAACPANVNNPNTTCDTNNDRCAQSACNATTHRQQVCACIVFGNNNTGRWFCGATARCQ
jgi:hypothetical protein